MGNERQPRQLTKEEIAEYQEQDRQWRLTYMPPQQDINGIDRVCIHCQSPLHPLRNRKYDATTGGFCDKLCAKDYEQKLMKDGMSAEDAGVEIDKYEDWKPKKHSPVIE